MYKQKTEVAKKEYLKALAAYRASLVSKVRNKGYTIGILKKKEQEEFKKNQIIFAQLVTSNIGMKFKKSRSLFWVTTSIMYLVRAVKLTSRLD